MTRSPSNAEPSCAGATLPRGLGPILLAWLVALLAGGCTRDGLYTYCEFDDECGFREEADPRFDTGERRRIRLRCVQSAVQVDVMRDPDHLVAGSFCTLSCTSDLDCRSTIGLPNGRCVLPEEGGTGSCYQRCASQSECYPSSTCEEVLDRHLPVRICLPHR